MARQPLTLADISMLALAADVVRDRGHGAISFTVRFGDIAECHVTPEVFARLVQDLGVEVTAIRLPGAYPWRYDATYGRLTFFCLSEAELYPAPISA